MRDYRMEQTLLMMALTCVPKFEPSLRRRSTKFKSPKEIVVERSPGRNEFVPRFDMVQLYTTISAYTLENTCNITYRTSDRPDIRCFASDRAHFALV